MLSFFIFLTHLRPRYPRHNYLWHKKIPGIKPPGIPGAIPVMTSPVMPSPSRPALAKLMFLYRVFFSAHPHPQVFEVQKKLEYPD